jgi:hypothetical protein
VIGQRRFPDGLYVQLVSSWGQRVTAKVHGMLAGSDAAELHQILAVGADVGDIVIDGGFLAAHPPLQGGSGQL